MLACCSDWISWSIASFQLCQSERDCTSHSIFGSPCASTTAAATASSISAMKAASSSLHSSSWRASMSAISSASALKSSANSRCCPGSPWVLPSAVPSLLASCLAYYEGLETRDDWRIGCVAWPDLDFFGTPGCCCADLLRAAGRGGMLASAKVPKVGSVCKGILALALQIQDYCPSYKGLQGLLRPCEDCKDSTYLVMILYSTTSNHLAMQGNYIYFLLLHR